MDEQFLLEAIPEFKKITEKPELFLNTDEKLSDLLKQKLKNIYDFSKADEVSDKNSNALPELIISKFNLEQIWQQIELQNNDTLSDSLNNVSRLIVAKNKLVFKDLEGKTEEESDADSEENDSSNEVLSDKDSFGENIKGNIHDLGSSQDNDIETSENDEQTDIDMENSDNEDETEKRKDRRGEDGSVKNKSIKKGSVVDDEFFKLSDMENFLKQEEKKINEQDSGNDSDDDSNEEGSINFFEEDSEENEEDKMKTARFKDFFVAKQDSSHQKKKVRFSEENEDEEDEGSIESDPDEINEQVKSTIEKREERLKRKIEELEEQAIAAKPWQLKGEVSASTRPQNSLLEEVLEFDMTSRPAPVITEQTTLQLEDIIRQRIKDKVFDSVERKAKPVETPLEFKKKLVLDQEKSKLSLAQIYEKEYQDQAAALDPETAEKEEEEPELHKEVRKMISDLFRKLDALSNFHFTPKPAVPELKVVNNIPAINMEEVAPVATSDATLLAPEEIQKKPRGDVIGKSEMTATDRNRERRKKKKLQRAHLKAKQEKEKKKPRIEIGVPKKYKNKGRMKNKLK